MAEPKYYETTLAKRHFSREIGRWGENEIRRYYGLAAGDSLVDATQGLLFFITMTFDQGQMLPFKEANGHLGRPNPSYEFDQGTHFYNQFVRRLGGKNRRPDTRPPLMIVGLDFDGSRSMGGMPDEFTNFHLHIILAVDPKDKDRVQEVLDLLSFQYRHKLAVLTDSIDVRPFDHEKYSVAEAVSYLAKGEAIVQGQKDWGLAIRRYPNPEYKLTRVYTPLPASQRRLRNWRRQAAAMRRELEAEEQGQCPSKHLTKKMSKIRHKNG